MAIIHGSSAFDTGLVEAPEASIYFNRDGSMSGKFFWNTTMAESVPGFLAIGDDHPYDGSAHVAQYGYKWDEAGVSIGADADYVGVWSTTVNAVDAIATTQQEAIQVHPAFASSVGAGPLAVDYTNPTSPTYYNNAQFDGNPNLPSSTVGNGNAAYGPGDFICFPGSLSDGTANPMGGVTTYLNPGLTIRLTYTTTSQGTVEGSVNNIGTIQDSLTAGSITYTYTYDAWMCTNVTYKEIVVGTAGSIFSVTEEWLFTQPPGWNGNIYPIPS